MDFHHVASTYMSIRRGARGPWPSLDFENLSKKDSFLSFEWEKTNFSSLSFSCKNAVTNGTNLWPIKAMRRDERFLSLALKTQFLLLNSILKTCLDEAYPNVFIALRIMLNCPNTVASAEKNFRKLKLIKTFNRSHTTSSRLSSLAMLSIETSCVCPLDLEDVIKQWFSSLHGLWPPSKNSQHLWPPAHQQGFAIPTAELFSKGLCSWPPGNPSVVLNGCRSLRLRKPVIKAFACQKTRSKLFRHDYKVTLFMIF